MALSSPPIPTVILTFNIVGIVGGRCFMPVIVPQGREAKIHLDTAVGVPIEVTGIYIHRISAKTGGAIAGPRFNFAAPTRATGVRNMINISSLSSTAILATVLESLYSQFKKLYRKNDFLAIAFKSNRPQCPCGTHPYGG